jgi:uncharacterized protein (UPF0548 family)
MRASIGEVAVGISLVEGGGEAVHEEAVMVMVEGMETETAMVTVTAMVHGMVMVMAMEMVTAMAMVTEMVLEVMAMVTVTVMVLGTVTETVETEEAVFA